MKIFGHCLRAWISSLARRRRPVREKEVIRSIDIKPDVPVFFHERIPLPVSMQVVYAIQFRFAVMVFHCEPSLRVRKRASCLDALHAKRLLQLDPLHLVFANDGFKFFACHAFFSGALFYHICRPYATPHFRNGHRAGGSRSRATTIPPPAPLLLGRNKLRPSRGRARSPSGPR